MRAIDRIMRAYSRTHTLSNEQQELVRGELTKFIQDLLMGKKPGSAEITDDTNAPIRKTL